MCASHGLVCVLLLAPTLRQPPFPASYLLVYVTHHTPQVEPELIKAAEVAINDVINQLPKQLVVEAQQFRVARAAGKA